MRLRGSQSGEIVNEEIPPFLVQYSTWFCRRTIFYCERTMLSPSLMVPIVWTSLGDPSMNSILLRLYDSTHYTPVPSV